jgi:hypothetical protein
VTTKCKRSLCGAIALTFGLASLASTANAQTAANAQTSTTTKPMTRTERSELEQVAPVTTFYLKNASSPNDGNEILTALRLMLSPSVKMYLTPSQNALSMRALPDDVAVAARLIGELDLPKKLYRVTYTVNERDGGKRISQQHYAMLMQAGQRMTLKEGSKIPISTGRLGTASTEFQQQINYMDVGINFDSTLTPTATGGQLKSKVERSAVAEEKPTSGLPNPIIHQVVMEGVTMLTLGKPATLGVLDVPGSTKRMEIEATMETVP